MPPPEIAGLEADGAQHRFQLRAEPHVYVLVRADIEDHRDFAVLGMHCSFPFTGR